MNSEQVSMVWRDDNESMDQLEVVARELAEQYLDPVDLPKTRTAWRHVLVQIFNRGVTWGVRNFDQIEMKAKEIESRPLAGDFHEQTQAK